MSETNFILRFKQSIEVPCFASDIRKLAYLFENLEGLNKGLLVKCGLDSKYRELNKTQQNKLYRTEDRIQIIRLSKQSPLEIDILFTSLKHSIEIGSIFIEMIGQSEVDIRLNLESILTRKMSDDEWIEIYKRFKAILKIMRLLRLVLIINH